MRRRLIGLFMALALIVAACGDDDSAETTTTAAQTTTTAAETTTTTGGEDTTTTAAPATTEAPAEIQTINVGAVYSLTGPFADFAVIYQEGIDLVLDQVNTELEQYGYQLALVYEDSQANPNLGLEAFTKLVNVDDVPVALIAGGSPVVLASLPVAEENGVLVLQTGANSPKLVGASPNLVNVAPTGVLEAQAASGYSYEVLGHRKMAVVAMNNDFGIPLGEAAADAFEARGGEIVAVEEYDPTATDFGSVIAKIRDASPDVVYFASAGPSVAPFIKQSRERGVEAPFLGNAAFEGPATFELAADEGVFWTALDFGPEKEWATAFYQDFADTYGKDPISPAAVQADAIDLIRDAIVAIAESGGEVTGEAMRDHILSQQSFVGFSGPMFFPADGNTVRPLAIRQIQDGAGTRIATFEELEDLGILDFGALD